ncbi:nickel-dependent hydrogenase large subunit, partial [Streptomyces goshikiensis]|uniref:nickel-dependent hydrogenase large subunit n=1 Tax=Streptomyces goshikiensis TaxID=1942 RepID=UPI00364DF302
YSTSSVFRGYSVFMRGKDPRDAHFITSRICGICGDNHATCSVYAQNMAYGVKPPHLAEWIINLGESAEYMFDHNIFQENLVGVDYCEKMVRETNPGVLELAERTPSPHAGEHGYKTIADIMRSLNPIEGEFYREALQVSRYTREMFCLMEGRHVHPSTLYPGGVGTIASVQLFTDYMSRLMRYCEFMKRVVPLHDDLFDFFYEALPGYEEVGRRRVLLGCWGALNDPEYCDFTYANMTDWGRKMFVTPGVVVDGKLVTNDLTEINLGIRILLGSSYYDDWQGQEKFEVPDEGLGVGFTEAVRGVLSHHMVIRDGKIANYHPYPPTPWNASTRDTFGTPGPYEDAVQNTPIFEENTPENFKGIDIMRAVRSFDPCLPCGVHMYVGSGKTVKQMHVPTGLSGLGG